MHHISRGYEVYATIGPTVFVGTSGILKELPLIQMLYDAQEMKIQLLTKMLQLC